MAPRLRLFDADSPGQAVVRAAALVPVPLGAAVMDAVRDLAGDGAQADDIIVRPLLYRGDKTD